MAACMSFFRLSYHLAPRGLLLALAWVLVLQTPFATSVSADDGAEIMIKKGVALRRRGQDREAVVLFRQAYDVSHSHRAAAQLGLCELALEQWFDAEQHISEALLAESDPWVSSKRSTLEAARLAVRRHLASVRVEGDPKGAIVILNQRVLGPLPLEEEAWVLAGTQVASVSKAGYKTQSQTINVQAGERVTLSFKLLKPGPAVVAPNLSQGPAAIDAPVDSASSPSSSRSTWRPYAMWTSLGLGAASLSFALWNHVQHESSTSKFNDDKGDCYEDGGQVFGGAECDALASEIGSAKALLTVGYVGAAVFSGIAVALLATNPNSNSQATACSIMPASSGGVTLANVGLVQCSGTF